MHAFDLGLRRDGGITHVLDKGLGPRAWEDVLEVAGEHISIVKLGWGTAAVTSNLERKLEVLREKPVVIGGTFLEAVIAQDRVEEYKQWITELGLTHVEISDGTVDIPRERKLELIGEIALAVGPMNVVFEAPSKAAQAWFVKQFGPSVNLGNIPPEEVIPLETLRLGLRSDTMADLLLKDLPVPRA